MGAGGLGTTVAASGCLALAAVLLSLFHIRTHLSHYTHPQYQLHIVRILAMVPVYSLTSWFALVLHKESHILILQLLRDSYEAYVIYNFVVLLINYAGGDHHLCRYLEGQPRLPHSFPLSHSLPPMQLGPSFLNAIRASELQFVLLKPLVALLKLYIFFHPPSPPLPALLAALFAVVDNLTISIALYGLVLFYHAAEHPLAPHRPFEKFIAVKAIVFFSFWQGVVLSLAARLNILNGIGADFNKTQRVAALQDVLICGEMAVAAVAHYFVFSARPYAQAAPDRDWAHAQTPGGGSALLQVVDFRDVLADAKDRVWGGVGFEAELREQEPIVPSVEKVLGDVSPEKGAEAKGREQRTRV